MNTCILTGAGSGIGRATAIELSRRQDYDCLALIGRREETLRETRALMQQDKRILLFPFDLTDLAAIPALVADIARQGGGIHCLLNIAGYTDPQPLLTTTLSSMEHTYRVNVYAPFLLIRECAKVMRESPTPTKVLNVASTAGLTARPGWLSYASSKAALVSMSQTLSEELAEYHIKVYCVSPGRCATALRRRLAPGEDPGTIMQPEEVGHILANLVAADEKCLDGQNIVIRKR